MLYFLLVGHILLALLAYFLNERQNRSNGIGGKISGAKLFWLCFAILNYYVVDWVVIYYNDVESMHPYLLAFAVLFLVRAVIQLWLMYRSLSWTTQYGVLFNLVGMITLGGGLAGSLIADGNAMVQVEVLFAILWMALLALDSYYAVAFNRAVGGKTTGDQAIWFANESEPRFSQLTNMTKKFNVVLGVFYIFLVICLLYEHI
jgi:hypothetical protein